MRVVRCTKGGPVVDKQKETREDVFVRRIFERYERQLRRKSGRLGNRDDYSSRHVSEVRCLSPGSFDGVGGQSVVDDTGRYTGG